ncbi:MAG: hypothetical protein ACTSQJ_06745 [Promethearchaeota archaeon]
MSTTTENNIMSLKITKFPQHLLIPLDPSDEASSENIVSFQAMNYSSKNEIFKFLFEGENLNITISDELNKELQFEPGETKNFDVKINPVADGFGKLTITTHWLKPVQYTVKVQRVRQTPISKNFEKIFLKQKIPLSEKVDDFNPKDYILQLSDEEFDKAMKQLELKITKVKQIPAMRKAWEDRIAKTAELVQEDTFKKKKISTSAPSVMPTSFQEINNEPVPEVVLENIDFELKQLAKAYLAKNDLEKALELAMELSDENKKLDFYYNLIRAYNSIDLEGALQAIHKLKRNKKRIDLIQKLALDRVNIDAEQSGRIAFMIEDPTLKEKLMTDIIGKTVNVNPNKALKLSYLLDDVNSKLIILFNIAKKFFEQNNKNEMSEVLKQIIDLILNSDKFNLLENNFENPDYNNFKDAICCLAELDSPMVATSVIENLENQQLKEKLALDLVDVIYEMADEIKTKLEMTPILSQYYMINTFVSNVTNAIKDFSLIGGNVSNNLLLKDYNFNIVFISLFKFDFSIFPILDRLYNEIRYNSNKSISYYMYPSIDKHKESELLIINNSLKQFFDVSSIQNQLIIFNMDLIPYLGKPTVIFSSNQELNNYFNSKMNNLKESINVIVDDSFFQGGTSLENLKAIFPSNKCKIVNLVLSYEFVNDYTIFKSFIESLIN